MIVAEVLMSSSEGRDIHGFGVTLLDINGKISCYILCVASLDLSGVLHFSVLIFVFGLPLLMILSHLRLRVSVPASSRSARPNFCLPPKFFPCDFLLPIDVSYAAPQAYEIVNVTLHQEYSPAIVFIFFQGRNDLYHV
jgi:hypothetical protein